MARTMGKLTALKVSKATKPGMYADGGGLYLQVTKGGASWIYRYWVSQRDPHTGDVIRDLETNKVRGTSREMGIGSRAIYGLQEARANALEARRLRHEGIDPIEHR